MTSNSHPGPVRALSLLTFLGIPVHILLRIMYGYGLPTGLYICIGAASLMLLLATPALLAMAVSAMRRRSSPRTSCGVAILVSIAAAVVWCIAFLGSNSLVTFGARLRVDHLGGQLFVTQLVHDAAAMWPGLPERGSASDARTLIMPSSFSSLSVTHVRRLGPEDQRKGLVLLSDRPLRSAWVVLLESDSAPTTEVKTHAIHDCVYRR